MPLVTINKTINIDFNLNCLGFYTLWRYLHTSYRGLALILNRAMFLHYKLENVDEQNHVFINFSDMPALQKGILGSVES